MCTHILDCFDDLLPRLLLFMSSSLHDQTCFCSPKRVNIKDKYHIVGNGTVNKIKPHASCTIRVKGTRVCNECYRRYTRTTPKTVKTNIGIILTHPSIFSTYTCMKCKP